MSDLPAELAPPLFAEITYTSHDGLTLYARRYGASTLPARPVVCLPGISRNSRDFDTLATFLSTHPTRPRCVYAVDYRGRGRSAHDPNWRNYSPYIEMLDVLDLMTIEGITAAGIVGTSRGGIIAMLLAAQRPAAVGAVVLNDIGPVIETAGLARLIGYVARIPTPMNWAEAGRIARTLNGRFFPQVTDEEWEAIARDWWNEQDGRPAPAVDPALAQTLSEIDISEELPTMWPHFEALRGVPVLVLRGEHSDVLSAETVAEMERRHPHLNSVTIPGQGHAPMLRDRLQLGLVADFLRETAGGELGARAAGAIRPLPGGG